MFEKLKSGLKGLVTRVTTVELKPENVHPILSDFKMNLVENDVAFPVAERICSEMEQRLNKVQIKRLEDRKNIVEKNLKDVLLETMKTNNKIDLLKAIDEKRKKGEPFVIVFVGINGTGKTTTIAKVCRFLNKHGYSAVIACSDTYRAGSIEQLEEHARRLGIRMIKHAYGADPAAVAYDTMSPCEISRNQHRIDRHGRKNADKPKLDERTCKDQTRRKARSDYIDRRLSDRKRRCHAGRRVSQVGRNRCHHTDQS